MFCKFGLTELVDSAGSIYPGPPSFPGGIDPEVCVIPYNSSSGISCK